MADNEVGVKLSVKDRVKFSRDMRAAADDVDQIGDAASRSGSNVGQFGNEADRSGSKWESFGRKVKNVGGQLDTVGRSILVGLGRSLKIVTAGAATLFGGALFGGGKRLLGLENAEARMKSMGLRTREVTKLSAGLLDVLEGTPFALDEGALSMQKLVSSGRPLPKIKSTMTMIADAAAFAQVPLDEVADTFARIQTQGRVTGNDIQMLERRGIPAIRMLADAANVTGSEMRGMISDRQIGASRFFNLYEKASKGFGERNIKIAGAAQAMGDTTSGAFKNMLTAASRFGARLLGPVFGSAKKVFSGITDWLDEMGEKVGPFAEQVGKWLPKAFAALKREAMPVLRGIGDAVRSVVGWFERNREAIVRVTKAVVPAVAILGSLAVGINLVKTAWIALRTATPIGLLLALTSALVVAYQESETFRNIVKGLGRDLGKLAIPIGVLVGALGAGTAAGGKGLIGVLGRFIGLAGPAGPVLLALGALGYAFWDASKDAERAAKAVDEMSDALLRGSRTMEDFRGEWEDLSAQWKEGGVPHDIIAGVHVGVIEQFEKANRKARKEVYLQRREVRALTGGLSKLDRGLFRTYMRNGKLAEAVGLLNRVDAEAIRMVRKRGRALEGNWRETERLMNATERYQDSLKTEKQRHKELIVQLEREDQKLKDITQRYKAWARQSRGAVDSVKSAWDRLADAVGAGVSMQALRADISIVTQPAPGGGGGGRKKGGGGASTQTRAGSFNIAEVEVRGGDGAMAPMVEHHQPVELVVDGKTLARTTIKYLGSRRGAGDEG